MSEFHLSGRAASHPRSSRWLVALTVALLAAPLVASAAQCPSAVVGYWPLDGNGTESVNGFAGTAVGTVAFVPGVAGQALSLGGDGSYVDVGAHPELTAFPADEMTVAAWVLRQPWPGVVGDGLGAVITARTYCNAGGFQLYAHLFGDELYYSKWAPGGGVEDTVSSTYTPFPTAVWKHIAATYTSDEVRFYVDGALVDEEVPVFGGPINPDLQNVQIGWDSCGSYWTGLLDEVVVYDQALDDGAIADLYARGLDGVSACATPAELIADLVGDVVGFNLQRGIANSLDAKLSSALDALADLNQGNDGAALHKLEAFLNEVHAQRDKSISAADADALIASCQAIIDLIEGG